MKIAIIGTAEENRKREEQIAKQSSCWTDERYFYDTMSNCRTCKYFETWFVLGGPPGEHCNARPLATCCYPQGDGYRSHAQEICPFYRKSQWKSFKQWLWSKLPL